MPLDHPTPPCNFMSKMTKNDHILAGKFPALSSQSASSMKAFPCHACVCKRRSDKIVFKYCREGSGALNRTTQINTLCNRCSTLPNNLGGLPSTGQKKNPANYAGLSLGEG